jgi:hypothetical protein
LAKTIRQPNLEPAKRITVQSAKAKGRSFQGEVRDLILSNFSSLEPDDCRSTSMGAQGEDLQLSPLARKTLGNIQIECKRRKSFKGIYDMVDQASSHGKHTPVVFIRQDRSTPLVIIPADHYMSLIKKEPDEDDYDWNPIHHISDEDYYEYIHSDRTYEEDYEVEDEEQ